MFYREDRNDYSRSGFVGIVGGTLIFVAGGVGIVLYKDPQNYSKNLSRMAFSILACCVSVVGIGFFSEGVMEVCFVGFLWSVFQKGKMVLNLQAVMCFP